MKFKYIVFIIAILNGINGNKCPNFTNKQWFTYLFSRICPIIEDKRCLSFLPIDVLTDKANCINYNDIHNNHVRAMNISAFENLKKKENENGIAWCSLVIFYREQCIFTEKSLPIFKSIPHYFSKLLVIAVKTSENSKIFQMRVVEPSPTIVLLSNGEYYSRIPTVNITLEKMVDKILEQTDLEVNEDLKDYIKEKKYKIIEKEYFDNSDDDIFNAKADDKFINVQLKLAIPTSVLSGFYLYIISEKGKFWRDILINFVRPLRNRFNNLL
ncbi:Thioredoxin-like fold domain-containing protein [Strongyloides ratti]|uniref:Thioredoxin-like fold domain-containing protein n=1 Tax=Strongyloides ratti TaxID=34506 RepID=A0A090LBS1_STRRB|nr:Thioredoxin-like fold domain-containing protein [Strongyloides ratti]CEF65588.1 Thioredoxin-like fold domain-containing protein [Strongyloides ratti]